MENSVNNNGNSSVVNNSTLNNNVNTVGVANTVPSTTSNTQTVVNNQQTKKMNIYVVISIVVGIVLLIAILLLVLLLTGSISSRNRLTCTRTTKEEGYTYTIEKVYKLEDGKYTRYDNTYTFAYDTTLTDDMYNQEFDKVINELSGVTEYGFDTKISKDGNVVTITSYYPKFDDLDYNGIKSTNAAEGFTCD